MAIKEILLRLPAKSALNLKLVCKQWLRLFRNEAFGHAYFLRKSMDKKLKIMLVGKGTGKLGFSFSPLNKWPEEASDHYNLLDRKVVCSKPCHGLNLVSIENKDYLYNPCSGFSRTYFNRGPHMHQLWKLRGDCFQPEDHLFAVGNKNVGLGFDPLIQEHVIVEIFSHVKDYKSRQYYLTCFLWSCDHRQAQQLPPPPLPANDMPPAYLEGMLYWMSDPRLGQCDKWAIISFNICTKIFDVIPCPSCISMWNSKSPCHAFVVELGGVLCAVLVNPVTEELDIWKYVLGQWYGAYTIYLKSWPECSLGTNIVVPLAIDPIDGKILLSTGRKLGLYDPLKQAIEKSFALDQTQLLPCKEQKVCTSGQLPFGQTSTTFGKNLSSSRYQFKEELNQMRNKLLPLVPILYEESLTYYPGHGKFRFLQ